MQRRAGFERPIPLARFFSSEGDDVFSFSPQQVAVAGGDRYSVFFLFALLLEEGVEELMMMMMMMMMMIYHQGQN